MAKLPGGDTEQQNSAEDQPERADLGIQLADNRRQHRHDYRARQQHQRRLQRGRPLNVLQEYRNQEGPRVQGNRNDAVDNQTVREAVLPEDGQIKQRLLQGQLSADEIRQGQHTYNKQGECLPGAPAPGIAFIEGKNNESAAEDDRNEARQVKAFGLYKVPVERQAFDRYNNRGHPDRHVNQEQRFPAEVAGQPAAQCRPEGRCEHGGQAP
ncbi:hypothetical protein D3C73_851620 [compost metagenome]